MGVPNFEPAGDETLADVLNRIEPLARDGAAALPEGDQAPNVEDSLRRLGESAVGGDT